jgi:hypothetical protein
MSCAGNADCTCGCCSGISVQTPAGETNVAGLSAISYRTGTWATFYESMLARLSSSDYPALAGLKTRDNDDFSIALLDASAVMLDILTFYQERLANESYLRTATQLYSMVQLSQLIGYQPSPGVSASTYLAFTLTSAPGLPDNPNTAAITIPLGTTVQSVPPQGQTPQSFETSAAIPAKPDWNALPVQTGKPWVPVGGQTSVYLAGTSTQLNPGDAFLIVGDERLNDPNSLQWDIRIVNTVQPDTVNQRTLVTWLEPLGSNWTKPAKKNPKFHALRQKAALFGYNAINPLMLSADTVSALSGAGLLESPLTWIKGSVTSGTFQPYENVTQNNTEAYANLTGTVPSSLQMAVGAVTGTADATDQWVGSSSGAVFTPTSTPTVVNTADWVFGWDAINSKRLGDEYLVDLDAVYTKVTPGSWIALINPTAENYRTPAGYITLYNARSVTSTSRSDYGMSAKITRVNVDNDSLLRFYYGLTRVTSALAQSDLLPAAEQPLDRPLYGTFLDLEEVRQDLVGVSAVAIIGKSQKIVVNTGVTGLSFVPDDGTAVLPVLQGDTLTLLQPPKLLSKKGNIPRWSHNTESLTLVVADSSGRSGTVQAQVSQFSLTTASSSDPVVQEFALIASVALVPWPFAHTRLVLQNPLTYCYDRTMTTVNANVAPANGGSSVTELLGNGSAAIPNQSFKLKQSPLTYTQAATPTGSTSSLQVTANGAAWTNVPSLYAQAPNAQVFTTINQPGGVAVVQFGDGEEGSTLPTGQNNIIANYRIGIGAAGNVASGSITTLVDRPVGVSGVTNPSTATGGQDAQSVDDIRANAPLSVLTLGRAVSITDYQNFAATFAGISRAYALWIPNGPNRCVFLTLAGANGASLTGSQTITNLITALHAYGNPQVPIVALSFYETLFRLNVSIAYDPAYDVTAVNTAVMALLTTTYSFASRDFGQGVSSDEIAALLQSVDGVIAVNVTGLTAGPTSSAGDLGTSFSVSAWNNWIAQWVSVTRPNAGSTRICPYVPIATAGALPAPAEILVLDPRPNSVNLAVMA